jgi:D-serine deaminase-like pyridoxal phosphate-dependent protein
MTLIVPGARTQDNRKFMSANSTAIGLPLSELETPALCLDLEAYRRNAARMVEYIRAHGLAWRPHMKGQKVTELGRECLAAGAIGVTCATLYEAEAVTDAGVTGVLIANQIAGERKLRRLAELERRDPVITATDCAEHAGQLSAAATAAGVTIPLLVEIDVGMGRCGVAPGKTAAELGCAIARLPGLRFLGVMAWEGHVLAWQGDEKRAQIAAAMAKLVESAEECRRAGLAVEVVSAAGSGTFLMAAESAGLTEVQAGGGVFSDLNYQKWGLDHEFALTVIARVVSRPTPTRIILDAGFKTLSFQHGYPRALGVGALKSMVLTAEHGILELEEPDATHKVGDLVTLIPGYTDSTVCLHDEMCVVRDGVLEKVWAIPGRTGWRS